MLIETKGAIPNSYMHAFKENIKLINENEQVKKLVNDKEEQINKIT